MESACSPFFVVCSFESLDFSPAGRDHATRPATCCCRCRRSCKSNFHLSTLTTLANRDPHGTTTPCYARPFTARVIETYGFHLSSFNFHLFSVLCYLYSVLYFQFCVRIYMVVCFFNGVKTVNLRLEYQRIANESNEIRRDFCWFRKQHTES